MKQKFMKSLVVGIQLFTAFLLVFNAPISVLAEELKGATEATQEILNEEVAKNDAVHSADMQRSSENENIHNQQLTIMQTNDIHGHMQGDKWDLGMARLKTYKDQVAPDLLIDSGDAIQGLPLSNFSKGLDMIHLMNAVGYDAMAVGNHEFDFGFDTLLQYRDQLNFPLLANNIYKNGELVFKPYTIVEKSGEKIAIIGVTTPETALKTHPDNVKNLTFTDPITETQKTIQTLQDNEPDIAAYIVTSHLGISETTPTEWRGDTLAQHLNQIFPHLNIAVLDGHSHTKVSEGKLFGQIIYSQTGSNLNNVGLIKMSYSDLNQKTVEINSTSDLTSLTEDAVIKVMIEDITAKYDVWGSEVVIQNNPYLLDGEHANIRNRETNLGNLITDSLLNYGQTGFSHPSDFTVLNGGDIRSSIQPGQVTRSNIVNTLPFGNPIAQIKVTGSQVKEMFEHSLRAQAKKDEVGTIILDDLKQPKLSNNPGFLHISKTIRVYYDSTKQGTLLVSDDGNTSGQTIVGQRVLQVEIQNKETQKFEPIDENKTYYMATNDFLASGGDGYEMLGGEKEEGPSIETIFGDYLNQLTTIRLYRSNDSLDLNDYKEPLPNSRVISISEENYQKLTESEETKDPEKPKPEENAKPENSESKPEAAQKEKSDENREVQDKILPATGEYSGSYLVLGLLLMSSGVYFYSKKKIV